MERTQQKESGISATHKFHPRTSYLLYESFYQLEMKLLITVELPFHDLVVDMPGLLNSTKEAQNNAGFCTDLIQK